MVTSGGGSTSGKTELFNLELKGKVTAVGIWWMHLHVYSKPALHCIGFSVGFCTVTNLSLENNLQLTSVQTLHNPKRKLYSVSRFINFNSWSRSTPGLTPHIDTHNVILHTWIHMYKQHIGSISPTVQWLTWKQGKRYPAWLLCQYVNLTSKQQSESWRAVHACNPSCCPCREFENEGD